MQGPEKKNITLTLLSALLFGSSVSLIVTNILITKFNLNFLSLDIPEVSAKLAYDKTFDILDFGLAGAISLGFFLTNYFGRNIIFRVTKKADFSFATLLLFIFSGITFMQTHFIIFSSKQVLVMVAVFELVYFLSGWIGENFKLTKMLDDLKNPDGQLRLQNGIYMGFLFLLLANILTTMPVLSLSFLFITPVLIMAVAHKKVNSFLENFPGFLILSAIFFPTNSTWLFLLLIILSLAAVLISKSRPQPLFKKWLVNFLNPALIVFLVAFNPTFNIGNFDTVEEGFWLAWVQRLINGEVLYRDVAVYHSPLIPWGMYLFLKFNGFTLYFERLFLHLLQVAGFIIYFFFTKKLIKNTFFPILALFVFMAVTSSLVRNNIEIRLGISLLSFIAFFGFLQSKKVWMLFTSGLIGVLSFMLSIESGLAVLLTLVVGLNIFSQSKFFSMERAKENLWLLAGIIGTLSLFVLYLISTGSLAGFIEQTSFYAKAFSQGYFNTAMERSVTHSYFHFNVFDEYLDSVTLFWESTKLVFFGFLIFGLFKMITNQKISNEVAQVLVTAFFGLILTRAALGRSDWYHLLSVLGVALTLLFCALTKLSESRKIVSLGLILFLILVMARPSINNAFLSSSFFKFQSYGKVFGEYKAYYFDRGAGALIGSEIDTQPMLDLVKYVQLNSGPKDAIFIFPWNPEIYFYTDRKGATKFDTPYAFFSGNYQDQMIDELKNSPPKFIIYDANMNFGGLTTRVLGKVNEYILTDYKKEKNFGPFDVLIAN